MYWIETEGSVQAESCATAKSCKELIGHKVKVKGFIQQVRTLGGAAFLLLRDQSGFIQVVLEGKGWNAGALKENTAVSIRGLCRAEERAPGGYEIAAEHLEVLSAPEEPAAISLGKKKLGLSLETELEQRPLTLRHRYPYHLFRVQQGLVQGFRQALATRGFTEIFSPKLAGSSAEGGANVFSLEYFGQEACLVQSPQLYKQMMVGVYSRVFETGHVYRAEQHCTSRHLNEYVSLDLEVGFIEGLEELVELQTAVVREMMTWLSKYCGESLQECEIRLPEMNSVPVLHLEEAKAMLKECSEEDYSHCGSLPARAERELCKAVYEKFGSEFVFVTHYTSAERPFYAKESPGNSHETESFDLLFRGMEIVTGGMRINQYQELVEKMKRRKIEQEPFRHYLTAFRYGMPPHGGSGMGLERLTMLLAGEENIRRGSLFPRDMKRLAP